MNQTLVDRIPLFEGARRRDRRAIAALADELVVPAGRRLTREVALATEFFVVVEGRAHVASGGQHVGELGPGDMFGELGLLDGPVRTATVTAASALRVLVVGSREFGALVERFPVVGARIRATADSRRRVPAATAA